MTCLSYSGRVIKPSISYLPLGCDAMVSLPRSCFRVPLAGGCWFSRKNDSGCQFARFEVLQDSSFSLIRQSFVAEGFIRETSVTKIRRCISDLFCFESLSRIVSKNCQISLLEKKLTFSFELFVSDNFFTSRWEFFYRLSSFTWCFVESHLFCFCR